MCERNSFTLLELVIVILIVSIFIFLVLPEFSRRYQEIKFENFFYKVVEIFKSSQNLAIKEGKAVVVKAYKDKLLQLIGENMIKQLVLPEAYKINSEVKEVYFYPTGELKLVSGSEILDIGEIELSWEKVKKKISLWASSGNIFFEE